MLYQTPNPHGGDIYQEKIRLDFSANTNPFGTPQGVLYALGEALSKVHHYPDPYCRELIRAISDFEAVPGEGILCGNGAAELIYAYCEAVRPKKAVELAPTFSEYSLGLQRVGCRVERYFLDRDSGFSLDERFLRFLETEKPEAVFLCNPNNPTGRSIPAPLLKSILHLCQKEGMRLFLDECFLDLSDGCVSLKDALRENPRLFLLKAFTKSYGMAGIRLGYGLSADRELLMRMSQATQPWNVSLLAQTAGVAALREGPFLQKTRALIQKERKWLTEQLKDLGFWVCPSEANFLLFEGPEGLREALRKRQIAIRGCGNYYGLTQGWYRIAVRLPEENRQLIDAIALALGKEQPWQKTL